MQKLIELRNERGQAITAMRAIKNKADTEKRALTAEEQALWDKTDARQEELRKEIASLEKTEADARRLDQLEEEARRYPAVPIARPGEPSPAGGDEARKKEVRKLINEYCIEGRGVFYRPEYRAMQADVLGTGGQIRIPEEFNRELIKASDDSVHIRNLARKFTLMSADSLGTPSLEADPADAAWTAEIGAFSEDSTQALGKRELKPHLLTKGIKISMKLLRIAAIDPLNLVLERLRYKFDITEEKAFLTGTGAGQPLGVFTASNDGIGTTRDTVCASATAFTADELITTLFSLKESYQRNARWLMHRDGVRRARQLKDSGGQYLWQPGLAGFGINGLNSQAGGSGDTLLNKPVHMSEYAPSTFTAGLYVAIVGDFQFFWIADALTLAFQRLDELFAGNNQVGFIGRKEVDALPVLGEAFARVRMA
jgi:HK97 family phage major capsid protein